MDKCNRSHHETHNCKIFPFAFVFFLKVENRACDLKSRYMYCSRKNKKPLNIPSWTMVPYNSSPLGISSLAYSTTLNLLQGFNARMISWQRDPALYLTYVGKSMVVPYVETMPTSFWLLHKGPLMHCCLCIILLLPHTHTYSSLLLGAIFFSFFKGPVLRKVQEGNEQLQRGVASLHLCCDAYFVYFYHLRLLHRCTSRVRATSACCGELFFNITHQMASAACEKKA